jgi:hypothetical protein
MAAPQPVALDYGQPVLPSQTRGWPLMSVDTQIITKSDGWNPDQTERLVQLNEIKKTGATHVALAVPYDNLTKYTAWVTDARSVGLKIWHRSHWNAWQGDNGVGNIATSTSLTRSGTTATCVTGTAHGLVTGDTVSMNGMNETAYRGVFTVTVVNATTFTYTVSGSPATPATGNIGWRFACQTYNDHTYDFFVNNSTLVQPGDIIGACVEADQADGQSMTFKTPGTTTFDTTIYNQFQTDQVRYINAAMKAIGLEHQVYTWGISHNLSNLNLNGQTLDSGNTGNSSGIGNQTIVDDFGGILCFDHYLSDTYRLNDSYWTKYSSDLDKLHTAFPDCKLFVGEWGYHTLTPTSDAEQHAVYEKVMNVWRSKSYLIGGNIWNHLGQTQSSVWTDTSGNINKGGRQAVKAFTQAFNTGNASYGWRKHV